MLPPQNPPDTLVKACTARAHSRLLSGDQRPTDGHREFRRRPTAARVEAVASGGTHRGAGGGAHGPALAACSTTSIMCGRGNWSVWCSSIAWTAIDYPTRLVVLHETNSAISNANTWASPRSMTRCG